MKISYIQNQNFGYNAEYHKHVDSYLSSRKQYSPLAMMLLECDKFTCRGNRVDTANVKTSSNITPFIPLTKTIALNCNRRYDCTKTRNYFTVSVTFICLILLWS